MYKSRQPDRHKARKEGDLERHNLFFSALSLVQNVGFSIPRVFFRDRFEPRPLVPTGSDFAPKKPNFTQEVTLEFVRHQEPIKLSMNDSSEDIRREVAASREIAVHVHRLSED